MISKFKNLFKKNDLDEQREFQSRALRFINENFPNSKVERSDDPLQIIWNENKLGLTNLYNNFLLSSQTISDFEELAKDHFEKIFSSEDLIDKDLETFEEVKSLIFPQMMPIEFLEQFSALHLPFGSEVVIGFVVDGEKAYRYLIDEDLKSWGIDLEEIYSIAVQNLAAVSDKLEMTYVPPPKSLIVVETADGFDAARILVPHMQEFFTEKLGESFYFGIPNRDFLICWSKNSEREFQETIQNQVAADFEERAYPISKHVFKFEEGIIAQMEFAEPPKKGLQGTISNN